MSTFCDVGGGFFFDDVIRCQLPPPCEYLIFSLFLMTHTKRCNLWDKGVKRPSVPNHPAKRLGVKRESEANPFSGFGRIFGNVQDCSPGLLSSRMLSIFLFPPINPFLILLSEG